MFALLPAVHDDVGPVHVIETHLSTHLFETRLYPSKQLALLKNQQIYPNRMNKHLWNNFFHQRHN